MKKLAGFIVLLALLSACSEKEQQEISGAPKAAVEKAEQVQQQLNELAEKQNQIIEQSNSTEQTDATQQQ